MKFYNPNLSDSTIDVSQEDVNKFLGGDQTLANSGYIPLPQSQTPDTSGAGVESGQTEGGNLNTQPYNPTNDLGDFVPFTETATGKADREALNKLNGSIGVLTPAEEAEIERQAQASGMQYDILLNQAREQKRQGMAQSNVRAGQAGGFESTQVAGVAAIAPTVGGTFEGQGGQLERVKSAYDQNISNLEVQKSQAIAAARNALREAKLTGKKDAFDRAAKLFEVAQKSHNEALDMIEKKANVLKILADTEATKNKAVDSFFKGSDIVALMKAIPAGETQQLTDPSTGVVYTINGAGKDNPNTITITDDKGVVRGVDKETGQTLWTSAPGVGKTKTQAGNTSINFPRQDRTPIYDASGKQVGYQAFNPISTSVTNFDLSGKGIDFPAGGRLGSVNAGFDSNNDPFDFDSLGDDEADL